MAGASGARSQAECDPGNHEPWGFGAPAPSGRPGLKSHEEFMAEVFGGSR